MASASEQIPLFLQTSVGPPFSGAGSVVNSVLFFGANWKFALSVASAAYCWANAKFDPGVPSSLTIFFDSRLSTLSPFFGWYVAKMWSNVRFSPTITITCWIGVRAAHHRPRQAHLQHHQRRKAHSGALQHLRCDFFYGHADYLLIPFFGLG